MQSNSDASHKRKNPKSRRDTAVQGTNDSSIISKYSMVTQGYFEDPYYEYFVNKCQRRAPLINRGYYIRVKTIDHILRKFLLQHQGSKQIISIGAGFDTSFFRLKSTGQLENTIFVEIDFPELVKRKHALISNQPALQQLLGEKEVCSEKSPLLEINTVDYKLLGVDLTQLNILDAALRMAGVDFDLPTVILSECVLTYMTRRCSTSVVGWGSETFANSIFVLYEQINPHDAFGMFMQHHFHIVGSPLKCINSYPTIESQKQRFLHQGWNWCEAYDMNQFYCNLIDQSERDRVEKLEPFDEHEEWHVKCNHYMVLLAYSSPSISSLMCADPKLLDFKYPTINRNPPVSNKVNIEFLNNEDIPFVKRFSHITGNLGNRFIVIFGGFGEQDGRHQRLTEIGIYNPINHKMCSTQLKIPDFDFPRMHLSAASLKDGRVMIIGGRNSPFKVSNGIIVISLRSTETDKMTNELSKCDIVKKNSQSSNISLDENKICDSETRDSTVYTHKNEESESNLPSNKLNESFNNIEQNPCERVLNSISESCENTNISTNLNSATEIVPEFNQIAQDSWTEETEFCDFQLTLLKESGDVPEPRWRHAVCNVIYQGVEHVIVYGGRTMADLTLNDCNILNTVTGEWKKLCGSGDDPGPRQSHTLCLWNNEVVLYGGLNDQLLPSSDIYILNLDLLSWRKLEIQGTLYPRYSHSCHVVNNQMIVIGGVNLTHDTPGVAVVNLINGESVEYSLPSMDKNNLILFHQHSSVMLEEDKKILVIGGGGNCFSFGTHLNKTPFLLDIKQCLV
ncbi:hypothetical protein SNE40_023096 [Patella caerulea]|uniref:tRNA wybutosine-synthesizing protein 4 n=1 Tax=Patella caerulea TaxID=87958 RepID=A0AAN8GBQ1_PATCE